VTILLLLISTSKCQFKIINWTWMGIENRKNFRILFKFVELGRFWQRNQWFSDKWCKIQVAFVRSTGRTTCRSWIEAILFHDNNIQIYEPGELLYIGRKLWTKTCFQWFFFQHTKINFFVFCAEFVAYFFFSPLIVYESIFFLNIF